MGMTHAPSVMGRAVRQRLCIVLFISAFGFPITLFRLDSFKYIINIIIKAASSLMLTPSSAPAAAISEPYGASSYAKAREKTSFAACSTIWLTAVGVIL